MEISMNKKLLFTLLLLTNANIIFGASASSLPAWDGNLDSSSDEDDEKELTSFNLSSVSAPAPLVPIGVKDPEERVHSQPDLSKDLWKHSGREETRSLPDLDDESSTINIEQMYTSEWNARARAHEKELAAAALKKQEAIPVIEEDTFDAQLPPKSLPRSARSGFRMGNARNEPSLAGDAPVIEEEDTFNAPLPTSPFGLKGPQKRRPARSRTGFTPSFGRPQRDVRSEYEKNEEQIDPQLAEMNELLTTIKALKIQRRGDQTIAEVHDMVKASTNSAPLLLINSLVTVTKKRIQEKIEALLTEAEQYIEVTTGKSNQGFKVDPTYTLEAFKAEYATSTNICLFATRLDLKVYSLSETARKIVRIPQLEKKIKRRIKEISPERKVEFKRQLEEASTSPDPEMRLSELQTIEKEVIAYRHQIRAETPIHRGLESAGSLHFLVHSPSSSGAISPRVTVPTPTQFGEGDVVTEIQFHEIPDYATKSQVYGELCQRNTQDWVTNKREKLIKRHETSTHNVGLYKHFIEELELELETSLDDQDQAELLTRLAETKADRDHTLEKLTIIKNSFEHLECDIKIAELQSHFPLTEEQQQEFKDLIEGQDRLVTEYREYIGDTPPTEEQQQKLTDLIAEQHRLIAEQDTRMGYAPPTEEQQQKLKNLIKEQHRLIDVQHRRMGYSPPTEEEI
jgi:hypothetical protein